MARDYSRLDRPTLEELANDLAGVNADLAAKLVDAQRELKRALAAIEGHVAQKDKLRADAERWQWWRKHIHTLAIVTSINPEGLLVVDEVIGNELLDRDLDLNSVDAAVDKTMRDKPVL